jgi:hypothetical protein
MKTLKAEQGSAQWLADRAGRPTASQFGRVITPKTGKLSTQAHGYMCQLVGERLLGQAEEIPTTYAMERGTELEPEAREAFQLVTGYTVTEVGLCLTDDERIGASPDGLIYSDKLEAGLELKCPGMRKHMEYLIGDKCPDEYIMQVQGCLFVTGAPRWYFMSYFPGLPPLIIEVLPDAKVQAALADNLPVFCDQIDKYEQEIRSIA